VTGRIRHPGSPAGSLRARLRPRVVAALVAFALGGAVLDIGTGPAEGSAGALPANAGATAERSITVRASAYNSVPDQTSGNPAIAAWGDRLRPGMRAIAVSADLLDMGLDHGSEVTIDGLPGSWVVLDRMPSRWERRIDIYMGNDVDRALEWGVQRVRIRFVPEGDAVASSR